MTSRVERNPLAIPAGVEVTISDKLIKVKGKNGSLQQAIHAVVKVSKDGSNLKFAPSSDEPGSIAQVGTLRALVQGMLKGVSEGYQKKLLLEGVGYRAQVQGKVLKLALGFSHPIDYTLPEGVTAETPSQTEIILKSANKQVLGQVAAIVRGFRPPEPYKGKGVRYDGEVIALKEGKKK
ncbi:MAG: 50S ribosomal protein L6 [Gammaproteobacteria bacterium]|jgi:large subunit ribosomal protein L6